MAYYFFHHPLLSRGGIPGRYAFSATGLFVDRQGKVERGRFRVIADGLADDQPGPNVDPSPFATPLPMIHSFCRIDRRGGKYYVPGTRNVLSELVIPKDVIVYGHLGTRQGAPYLLVVDSVLVVARIAELFTRPIAASKYSLACGEEMMAAVLGSQRMSLHEFHSTDLWKLNLSDAAPARGHHHTRLEKHRVIVGAVSDSDATVASLRQRSTSFLVLADEDTGRPPTISSDDNPCLWNFLSEWLTQNPRMGRGMKPPSRLPDTLGEALYDTALGFGSRWTAHRMHSVATCVLDAS